jgi:transposase InsO family protein
MSGLRVKIFRSDNGGEFINDTFTLNLEEVGIQHQCSASYAHQQNGKAERVMRMIKGRMYAMLDFSCLPIGLWGEAALTVCYLFNRTKSRVLPSGKTPYKMLHGVQPNLAHLCVFGSCCFACIPKELQEKLGPRSREAVFLGYPPGVKA